MTPEAIHELAVTRITDAARARYPQFSDTEWFGPGCAHLRELERRRAVEAVAALGDLLPDHVEHRCHQFESCDAGRCGGGGMALAPGVHVERYAGGWRSVPPRGTVLRFPGMPLI